MGNRHKTCSFDDKDTENTKKFRDIAKMQSQQPIANNINSSHLLEINHIQTENDNCSLSKCAHLKQLITVLTKYHSFIAQYQQTDDEKEQNLPTIDNENDISNKHYDTDKITSTINDFHHLLNVHQSQFEELYAAFIKECNNGKICTLSKCLMQRRNNRDRTELSANDVQLKRIYFNCDNINDIVNQQILDIVHCYYFHSFDTGYILSKNDRIKVQQYINDNDSKEPDENADNYCHDRIAQDIYNIIANLKCERRNSSKFVTVLDDVAELKYSYGFKYFYWSYYKNNNESVDLATHSAIYDLYPKPANKGYALSHFYVNMKYPDLKTELINNPICSISLVQWNNFVKKSNQFSQTPHFKGKKCTMHDSEKYYEIIKNSSITRSHLVAMMVYCNNSVVQREFCKTYRRVPKNESNDSLIKRHRNYANLGRLLRECVDAFGSDKTLLIRNMCLYRGISIITQFPSINAWIKGPCSTTTDYAVAANFAGNKGMILELCLNKYLMKNGLFECKYISDFPNEQEIFFIGGQCGFTFLSVIQVSSNQNFKLYIRALAKLEEYLCGWTMVNKQIDSNVEASDIEQICFRMISDELHRYFPENEDYMQFVSMPLYVRKLLHYHFSNITQIVIKVNEENFYAKLFHYLFYYDYGWIKLDLITTLFPNVQYIGLYTEYINIKLITNKSIYTSVLTLLKTKSDLKLNQVFLSIGQKKYKQEIQKFMMQFQSQFAKLNWKLYDGSSGSMGYGITMKSVDDVSEEINKHFVVHYD